MRQSHDIVVGCLLLGSAHLFVILVVIAIYRS